MPTALRSRPRATRRPSTEQAWLAALVDEHGAAVLGLAQRIVRDPSAAEDVAQEAFLAAWRGAAAFDPARGSTRTWLLAITRHRAIDALRHGACRPPVAGAEAGEPPAPERTDEAALRGIDAQAVRTALAALPAEQRDVVELAYFAGLTHLEIAERAGVPLGTVKGRMRLALEKLATALAAQP